MRPKGMLVLSRALDEEIVIGDGEIVVKVIRTGLNNVRLGIIAPKGMTVHRREVFEAIKRGERRAAAS